MDRLPWHKLLNLATALGISTVGETSYSLSKLVDEATNKPRAKLQACIIDPNALSKQFEDGRFTDCSIRVKINDDLLPVDRRAKRRRLRRPEATETEGPAYEVDESCVHVIKAHAVILASRSPYFERALGGEWRESQDRSIDVEVADEEEYVTLRRLIKLCYGTTFITEGDRDLDFSELVRLIHVANAFECMDAVKQCTMALQGGDLDWNGALQCLELAEMLKDVEGMAGLAKEAGYVIAKEVGPVHGLFTPTKVAKDRAGVLGGLRLSEKVKGLSPSVFEALLSSDHLQIKTENEAFWLLLAWVEAQSKESEGKQALFTRMAKHLAFSAMDPGYVLLLVSEHPRVIAAGLQGKVLREAFTRSNLARRSGEEVAEFHRQGPPMPPLTTRGDQVSWTFNVSFTATEATSIKPNRMRKKVVGLVAGLPWYVALHRWRDPNNAGRETARMLTMCKLPFDWMTYEGGAGFYFQCSLEVGLGTPRVLTVEDGRQRHWTGERLCGRAFCLWGDVFKEGSDWLVNGKLQVRLVVTISNDQGLSVSWNIQEEDEDEEDVEEGGNDDEDDDDDE